MQATSWSTQKLRDEFLKFFEDKNHTRFDSASLIPEDDPTLLFVNAGMVPFKRRFLGEIHDGVSKATSSQRCVRAGGKHNDLEQVGYTARHHTFFEMLGNFSFGDYFKADAIKFAWEFLTDVLKIDKSKLWITVFDKDEEAENIWLNDIGVDPNKFSKIGEKDNFWSMGDTGPCGPCTEIFYDHGEDVPGGPPGTPEEDGDRYVEIWNLVFMQYNRQKDGTLKPLPAPSVDTGMGLERIAAVMQGVHSNYDIDLFKELLSQIAEVLNLDKNLQDKYKSSMQAIADHIRSTSFLIMDGIEPGNEGRSYVLRRIIRRALRHAYQLGHRISEHGVFFCNLVYKLAELIGAAYPKLVEMQDQIKDIIEKEERQFAQTLTHGMKHLEENLTDNIKELSGNIVFKLYDTYGFPVDLTADLLREKNITLDHAGFEKAMEEQKNRARSSAKFAQTQVHTKTKTEFLGYDNLESKSQITEVFKLNKDTNEILSDHTEVLDKGSLGVLILDKTPFYAESGGQVGDVGLIELAKGEAVFKVIDTQKLQDAHLHYGEVVSGFFSSGCEVVAKVDTDARSHTRRHHSATHLLHSALREILGDQVVQKGSLVNPDKLRFDFSYNKSITQEQIENIEHIINTQILNALDVETIVTSIEEAKKLGAMALFGEKYGSVVRVLKMGDFSVEFCGGTHVKNTAECGLLKIIASSSIASGVRRVEAVCGLKSLEYLQSISNTQAGLSKILKCAPAEVLQKAELVVVKNKKLEKQIAKGVCVGGDGSKDADSLNIENLLKQVKEVGAAKLLVKLLPDDVAVNQMRSLNDQLKASIGANAVIVLAAASKEDKKVKLLVGVGDGLTDNLRANLLVNHLAEQVGGKGGGRADMAQAGGTDPENLDKALEGVEAWVLSNL